MIATPRLVPPGLLGFSVALLALLGWLMRFGVAAEIQVRAETCLKLHAHRSFPNGETSVYLDRVLVSDPDPSRRLAAVSLLGPYPHPSDEEAFVAALADPSAPVAEASYRVLCSSRGPRFQGLSDEALLRALAGCRVARVQEWLFGQVLQARPSLAEAAASTLLPHASPSSARNLLQTIARALGHPSTDRADFDPDAPGTALDARGRQVFLRCLEEGERSEDERVQALFAEAIAERGGQEISDAQFEEVLSTFRFVGDYYEFFRRVGARRSPRLQAWAERVVDRGDAEPTHWTLLAIEQTAGREATRGLAQRGLGSDSAPLRKVCADWIRFYWPKGH